MWVIVLAGILTATLGFCYATFMITPTYSSSVMLYVNNTSFSIGSTSVSISSSQITAAQSLVKTYSEILKNRTTLERVIDKTGVSYKYGELYGMIKAEPANETEIMKVTVTTTDPYESAKIANGIAEVLPVRVSEIIDGASMEVVDSAVPNLNKVAPSITKYTALGMIIGFVISIAVLAVLAIMDDTIHDEDYILQNYDCPILAKVPNLLGMGGKHYGYYYQSKRKTQK
jgi:capsular polysaccharide biosynthesis protein